MKPFAPRFQTRFSNGFWKTFDTVTYTSVRAYYLLADAKDAEARLNVPKVLAK